MGTALRGPARHRPIINQIRIPNWSDDDITSAAQITGSMLARGGNTRLAGGIDVTDQHQGTESVELLAELERLTLRGWHAAPRSESHRRRLQRHRIFHTTAYSTGSLIGNIAVTPHDYRPEFATNSPEGSETVGAAINTLLGGLRSRLIHPPSLAIATAYFNPGGFALLAEELEQVGGVRLLLGAEPDQEQPQTRPLGSSTKRRRRRNRSGPAPEVRRP